MFLHGIVRGTLRVLFKVIFSKKLFKLLSFGKMKWLILWNYGPYILSQNQLLPAT